MFTTKFIVESMKSKEREVMMAQWQTPDSEVARKMLRGIKQGICRGVARNFWGYKSCFFLGGGGIKLFYSRSDVIFTP